MRLFVAVCLPEDVREGIWQIAAPLRARRYPVRWVNAESIHLTLKFLGEVQGHRESEVVGALDKAVSGVAPFTLPIAGFGAFPNARRARVVWVGCEPVAPLELLQRQVEECTSEIGFPIEGRAFRAHLTLGRVKRGAAASALGGLDEVLERLVCAFEVQVESVELMQSELSRAGARYTVRHSVRLNK